MLLYSLLTLLFFIYQAAFGGLFFLVAKEFRSETNYHFLISLFLSAEPIIMIFGGVWISKKIDILRESDVSRKKSSYWILSLCTFTSLLLFYFFIDLSKTIVSAIGFYFLATAFLLTERIYRQRFPKDYAFTYGIPLHRVNALNNLATRGAPLISPLVLVLFPLGLSSPYIAILAFFSLSSAFFFSKTARKVSHIYSQNKEHKKEIQANSQAWGRWHVLHLVTMNFSFGALFFIFSQPLLTEVSLEAYLQSPIPLYLGFVGTMILITLGFKKAQKHLFQGVSLIVPMSLCLIGIAYSKPIVIGALLLVFGVLFALAINMIGTCVQQHLDHERFSFYETRAQVFGRISALLAITLSGFLLDNGFSLQDLEFMTGLLGLVSFLILSFGYKKLICRHS